jgi:hypothetical protein
MTFRGFSVNYDSSILIINRCFGGRSVLPSPLSRLLFHPPKLEHRLVAHQSLTCARRVARPLSGRRTPPADSRCAPSRASASRSARPRGSPEPRPTRPPRSREPHRTGSRTMRSRSRPRGRPISRCWLIRLSWAGTKSGSPGQKNCRQKPRLTTCLKPQPLLLLFENGVPGGIRTHGLRIRNFVIKRAQYRRLYPFHIDHIDI